MANEAAVYEKANQVSAQISLPLSSKVGFNYQLVSQSLNLESSLLRQKC